MNRWLQCTITAAGVFLAGAAVAQTPSNNPAVAEQSPQASGTAGKLSDADQKFVNDAAIGGMFEVDAGKIAEKSAAPQVRQFGARMVRDHTAADNKLKQIVSAQGGTLPSALDQEHQQKLDQLTTLHGQDFARQYMQEMVQDHDTDAQAFGKAAQNLDNPQLRQFAAQTLKVVESHDRMAHQITGKTASR